MIILVNCVIPVITTFLPKIVIDEITYGKSLQHLLSVTAVLTLTLAVISGLQKYLDRLIYWNRFKMNAFFLRRITKKGLTTDYRNQENEYFRKLQSESFASCNGNFSYWTQSYDAIVLFFSNTLGFLAFTGILLTLNSWLIVFLMLTTFLSFFLNRRIIKWVDGNTDEKADYEHRMQYIINASNDIQAAKDIRLYNMSVWMNQIYEKNMKGLLGWYRRYTAKLFGVATVDSGLSLVREGVTYLILLYMVFEDEISVADFVLYFNVVAGFSTWLSSLLGQLNNLERLNLSVNRFRSYLEYPEQYLREGGLSVQETKLPQRIELKNVSFQYEENGKEILKNINMVLEPGEHLAVVGLNGAGKTTLVKLICGLLEPTNGSVLYDGIDIRKYNREEFYQLFGAVFQDYSIMPVTIEEIVAEDISDNIDTKKVEDCLKQADIWEKIVSLEAGMKSKYDKTFWDDGINLSGGEIQKLLLARALYRESPIVILDEPTAALDPISENHLYETYDEVMKNKSTVFISHRLASTRFCNRILLIDHGSIIEEGTHEELLSQKGKYYDLFEAQAKYYRENPDGKADTDED
jgi:ATP-binding cassette subfamily B protein